MQMARENGFRGSAAFFALLLNAAAAPLSRPDADANCCHAVTRDRPIAESAGKTAAASKFSRRRERLAAQLPASAATTA